MVDLIPMFTDLDTSVSDMRDTGRTNEAEMDHVLALYKALGFTRDEFLSDVRERIVDEQRRTRPYREAYCDPLHRDACWHPFFVSEADLRWAAIASYVLRYQNFEQFAGLPIRSAPNVISDELIADLGRQWDDGPQCADWIAGEVALVLIDKRTTRAAAWRCGAADPVLTAGDLVLYRIAQP